MILTFLLFMLFCILINITCINSSIIPEESFIPLQSYIPQQFSLDSEIKEVYFYFMNSQTNGDVGIHFSKGNSLNVEMFIYTSIDSIQISSDGNYTSPSWHFVLDNERYFHIPANDIKQIKGKYYIIIKNNNNDLYNDSIELFNEFDIIPLVNRQPYEIQRLYSQKKYVFRFERFQKERIKLHVISENELNLAKISVIDEDAQNEVIFEEENNYVQKEIIFDEERKGINYLITMNILNDTEIYSKMIKNVMIDKFNDSIVKLNEKKVYEYNYIGNENFYFYVDLNNYYTNEENVITAFIDNYIIENNYYKGFFCKFVNVEPETPLLPLFPSDIEENECNTELANGYDSYYHLYFKNNKPKEENKNLVLLVNVIIQTNLEYMPTKLFTIALSSRFQYTDMSLINNDKISLSLSNYIPFFSHYSFRPSYFESYVIYSTSPGVLTTYIGNITTYENTTNTLINTNQLLSVSNYIFPNISEVVLKLFGKSQNVNLLIESTKSEILYFNNTRPIGKVISFLMTDCSETKYIIGNYNENKGAWLYVEELYGNFMLTYKNYININSNSQTVLPSINDAITKEVHLMDTNMDLIGIQCSIPGYLNLYMIDSSTPTQFEADSKNVIRLTAGQMIVVNLPNIIDNSQIMNIEFSTPYEHTVTIMFNNEEIKLTKEKPCHRISLKELSTEDTGKKINFLSSENTIVEIIIVTTSDLYTIISNEITNAQNLINQNLLFLLDNSINYSDFVVHITGLPDNIEYYYTIEHSYLEIGNGEYVALPQNSGVTEKHSVIYSQGEINMKFTNPYDKYKSTGFYYMTISFNSKLINEYNLTFSYHKKPTYEQLEQNKLIFISEIKKDLNGIQILKENNINKNLLIYLTKCGKKPYIFHTKYYNQDYNITSISKNYIALELNNPGTELQFNISYLSLINEQYYGLYVSYIFHNKEENINNDLLEQFNEEMNITYDESKRKISWKNSLANKYTLYMMEMNEEREKLSDNICFLETLNMNNENGSKIIIENITNKTEYVLEQNGKYIVNIIASFEKPLQFKGIYKSIIITNTITPNNEDEWSTNKTLVTLLIVFGVLILIMIVALIIKCKRKRKSKLIEEVPDQPEDSLNDVSNSQSEYIIN